MDTGHLNGNGLAELRGYNFQNLSSAPTTNLYKGRFYFNTSDNTLYVYNGSQWLDALAQGTTYTEGNGIDITSNTISVDIATGANAGNITLTADSNGLAGSAPSANTTTAGLIEIATDSEASTGTAENLAVNPKQLATKIGLGDLSIGSNSTTCLSYNSSNGEFDVLSEGMRDLIIQIQPNSVNYLDYNSSTGYLGAFVDTTVTANSDYLITSGAVDAAIGNALTGALKYQGTWTATSQTDYSSITLPVKKGYMYAVSGNATIGGVEWNSGDYLVINKDVASGGTITGSDVEKIDNTEASDIVRLSATQTLTNKTIDADDNTISDLTTSNLKSGVLQTTVRAVASASDTSIPSEKAVASALAGKSYNTQNPALTASGGLCTWTVTHNLNNSNVQVSVYEVTSGDKVMFDTTITSANVVTVKILSASNIAADTYKVVVLG